MTYKFPTGEIDASSLLRSKSSTSGHQSEGNDSKDTWDSCDRRSSECEEQVSPPQPVSKRRSLRSNPSRSKQNGSVVCSASIQSRHHEDNHHTRNPTIDRSIGSTYSESNLHSYHQSSSSVSSRESTEPIAIDSNIRFSNRRAESQMNVSTPVAPILTMSQNKSPISSDYSSSLDPISSMSINEHRFILNSAVKVEHPILIDRTDSKNDAADILELPMMSLDSQIDLEPTMPALPDNSQHANTQANSCASQQNSNSNSNHSNHHTNHNHHNHSLQNHHLNACSLGMRHSFSVNLDQSPTSPDDVTSCASVVMVEPIVVGLDTAISSDFDLAMDTAEDGLDGLDGPCSGAELLDQFHLDQLSGLLCFRRSGNGSELENDTNLNNVSHSGLSSSGSNSNVSIAHNTSNNNNALIQTCTLPLDLDKELVNMLSTSANNSNLTFLL